MKFKNKVCTLISAIVGTTIAVSIPFINNKNNSTHILNSNLNAWGNGGSNATDEAVMQLEFKSENELELDLKDFVPKKPNEFSNEDIKLFLKTKIGSSLGSSWYVQIEKLTNEDIVNGKIKFKVFQNKRKSDGSYEKVVIQNNSNDIWDTSSATQLSKYILTSKYKFAWANDEDLKSFFENTTVTAETLDKKTVLDNLVSKDAVLPDESKINVTFDNVGTSTINLKNSFPRASNGARKVTISFSGVQDSEWEGNKKPETSNLTNTFRGFKVGDSYSDMLMEANNDFVLANATLIDAQNKLFPGLLSNGGKISELTPSQFVSVVEQDLNNPTTFFNMITKGENIGNKPLVNITYMGSKTTDNDFFNITGLDSSETFSIKKIRTIPNDSNGSLQLIYTYDAIDIFTNKKVQKEFKQFFPANSFNTSQDANKILDFSWKADESLLPIGSSYNLVNLYKNNSTESTYLKELTNEFFIGSKDSYNQNRIVSIDYKSGGNDNSRSYEPIVSNESEVKITLTFDSWNGATYTDESGQVKKGFKTEKIFNLNYYKIGGDGSTPISINWKKQNDFISSNGSFVYELPSDIVRRIEKKQNETNSNVIRKNVFYTLDNLQSLEVNEVFIPDDNNGLIKVIIEVYQGTGKNRKSLGVFSNIYTGMKKSDNSSSVLEFSWVPDVGINPELLSKPIIEVTKEDVIQYYLNEISLFENRSLTANDVELEIIPDANGVEYLKINVTIPMFDQDKNNVDIQSKTFTTKITGFAKISAKGDNKVTPESDVTAIVSIPIAATTTCVFLVILNSMILRRSKIRKFKTKDKK